jgi:hypothetical protein
MGGPAVEPLGLVDRGVDAGGEAGSVGVSVADPASAGESGSAAATRGGCEGGKQAVVGLGAILRESVEEPGADTVRGAGGAGEVDGDRLVAGHGGRRGYGDGSGDDGRRGAEDDERAHGRSSLAKG